MLRIPLEQAQSELQELIDAGRVLANTPIPSLEGDPRTIPLVAQPIAYTAYQEIDELRHLIRQWTDYNRTWLSMNLGGEAASEYEDASRHVYFGSDDPRARLHYLRTDIGAEIAKLKSIYNRLPLWAREDDAASESPAVTETASDSGSATSDPAENPADSTTDPKAVMVIYGHDTEANNALFDWLRSIGLRPREWSQLVGGTGSGSPYIGQILTRAFQDAQAVVALFTPDEYVIPRTPPSGSQDAGRYQARPNVLIEAGMALVTHPDRTVIAVLGNLELPSDLAGRHYIRLSHTDPAPLHQLAGRLQTAGCGTDITGTDWLNPARFPDRNAITLTPTRAREPGADPEQGGTSSSSPRRRPRAAQRLIELAAASQVTVDMEPVSGKKHTHLITVSAPITYLIKWVNAEIAWQTNSGLGTTGTGFGGDPPRADDRRRRYTFRASVSPQIHNPEPIIRFVDSHGHLYYQFRHHTERFPPNTDASTAANQIDQWLRTGPNPD